VDKYQQTLNAKVHSGCHLEIDQGGLEITMLHCGTRGHWLYT